ncbi:hypothetical protein QBE52_06785 [Clostridiaceae bacterium 35-E11]
MEERYMLIEVVEKFLALCDDLFAEGKISEDVYIQCTKNKRVFLGGMEVQKVDEF